MRLHNHLFEAYNLKANIDVAVLPLRFTLSVLFSLVYLLSPTNYRISYESKERDFSTEKKTNAICVE